MSSKPGLMLLTASMLIVAMLLSGCNESDSSESNDQGTGDFLSTTPASTSRDPSQVSTTGNGNNVEVDARWPHSVMECPTTEVMTTPSLTCAQYDAMMATIRGIYSGLDTSCTANFCTQADWAGCVLRVAGHDLMDYANGEGGSDGCMDLSDPDNMGLPECLHMGEEFGSSIFDAYKMHCSEVSLADFIVIAAEAVMTFSREKVTEGDSSRGSLDFRSSFRFGRTTATSCTFAEGRLPNPENSCTAVETTFVNRMGLSWREATALMGVHTIGRARPENSGYDGWWSDAVNSRMFNNNYYASILAKGWMPERLSANKNQWQRADDGRNRGATEGKEMMLNTDMCLAFSEDRNGNVELRAGSHSCCAWVDPDLVETAFETYLSGEYCGSTNVPRGTGDQRELCCNDRNRDIDCGEHDDPRGSAFGDVRDFANNERVWLQVFEEAWKIATENGFNNLQPLSQC